MILDLNRPHHALDSRLGGPDFIEQDGIVFGWSESNCRYERAWWLDDNVIEHELVQRVRVQRPLPGETHAEVIAALGSVSDTGESDGQGED